MKTKNRKPRVIWSCIAKYPDGFEVCWGNWDTRGEARHACNNDNLMKYRSNRVVKFIEAKKGGAK